jgi:DNA-binding transcriptional MerR regulator
MFSIGEFARMGMVSVRTLRHYDEIGLLHPAQVDPETGYRSYGADQLAQLNRIIVLKDLGFSLTQTAKLLSGVTLDELRGMLALRRAQLERELDEYATRLREVEARLHYIEGENAMPADDITVKKIPSMGVVAIGAPAPGYSPAEVVPAVNQCRVKFDELGLPGLIAVSGPFMILYEDTDGADITVYVALPVSEPPADLPAPAQYKVLPAIEMLSAVRNGRSTTIFPAVFHDMARYASAHGYAMHGPSRNIWIHEIDDPAEVEEQVFEVQMPFTRT